MEVRGRISTALGLAMVIATTWGTTVTAADVPLRLRPPVTHAPTARPDVVARGRFLARVTPSNQLGVRDDRTGRRYEIALPAALAACRVVDVRGSAALVRCLGGPSHAWGAFAVADLQTGATHMLNSQAADQYTWLGRDWVRGHTSDPSLTRYDSVYVNRRTGRRVQRRGTARFFDADAAKLPAQPVACEGAGRGPFAVPDPRARTWVHRRTSMSDPKGDLFLMRCGRRPLLISRCPQSCLEPAFDNRVVAWIQIDRGATYPATVVVRATKSRRVYRRPVDGTPETLAVTARHVIWMTQETLYEGTAEDGHILTDQQFRTTELAVPRGRALTLF